MSVRLKFQVWQKQVSTSPDGKTLGFVNMGPCYGDSEENKKFFEATPGGNINFSTLNEAALAQLEQGKAYYIDITPAE